MCNNSKFTITGKETVNNKRIAEAFNNFMLTPSLASNTGQLDINPISYIDKEVSLCLLIIVL